MVMFYFTFSRFSCTEDGGNEEPPSSAFCNDNSFYKYGDSCFKVDSQPRSNSAAQDYCASQGGTLATVVDGYYEAFVEYILYSQGVSDAWIGLSRDSVSWIGLDLNFIIQPARKQSL